MGISSFLRNGSRLLAVGLLVLGPATGARASTNITTASLTSLKNALNAGGLITLSFDGTITTPTPLLITVDNTILDATGRDVTISGGGSTRIFDVATNVHFNATNLVISDGRHTGLPGVAGANGPDSSTHGGDGGPGTAGSNGFGGAVRNQGISVFVNCIFVTNTAAGGAGGSGGSGGNTTDGVGGNGGNGGNGGSGLGGAIYNLSSLVLSNCSFAGNTAAGGSGGSGGANGSGAFASYAGSGGQGGAGTGASLYNLGTATILDCTFNQNSAQGGTTPPTGGPPQGNGNGLTGLAGANAHAGGVANLGTTTVVNSTFDLNLVVAGAGATGGPGTQFGGTGGSGGSAFGASIYNTGTLSVTNATIADSAANGGAGGTAGAGAFAGVNGAAGLNRGDLVANNGGTFNFRNSILAYHAMDATNHFRQVGVNTFGTITDQGNNLSTDTTPAFTTTNSHNNTDPLVVQLVDNGGRTLTMELGLGSPALDAIFDGSAPALDQRGYPRPAGARPDIGAFETGAGTNLFAIGGLITLSGSPFAGVTLSVGGSPALTGSDGVYNVLVVASNSYTITPQPLGYFSPSSSTIYLSGNMTNINFSATNATASFLRTNTNSLQITFAPLMPTYTYRVQASTNLSNWADIFSNIAGSSLSFSFTTNTTNFPKRFFRTITP